MLIPFRSSDGKDFVTTDGDILAVVDDGLFSLILYKNTAELNRVDKTEYLTQIGELTGCLRDGCSIVNPTIEIEYNKVPDFNYVYIPIFNRYYFVTDVESVVSGIWGISMNVDTLMTYRDGIRSCTAFVDRSEDVYNDYIVDKKRVIETGALIETIKIDNDLFIDGSSFINGEEGFYILTGIGLSFAGEV